MRPPDGLRPHGDANSDAPSSRPLVHRDGQRWATSGPGRREVSLIYDRKEHPDSGSSYETALLPHQDWDSGPDTVEEAVPLDRPTMMDDIARLSRTVLQV